MTTRKTFWITSLALVACGLLVGASVGERLAHQDRRFSQAAWAEVFGTPAHLARGVDVVALVQPLSVSPGRVAVSENGEDALPFQLVELEVLQGFKGAEAHERLVLERAGGSDPRGRSVFLDADGGDLEVGGTYLLFLKRQPGSDYYYQVNHQGRYELRGGHFHAVAPDDVVAAHFDGATLDEGLGRAQRAVVRGARPAGPDVR